jgi:hypothetical protein
MDTTTNKLFDVWRIEQGKVIKVRTLAKTSNGAVRDVCDSKDVQYCGPHDDNTKIFMVDGAQEWKCTFIGPNYV